MAQIPDHYAVEAEANGRGGVVNELNAEATAETRYFTASEHADVVRLRNKIQALAIDIDLLVPPGRNKALALTALEDVQMRGNRGIFAPEHLR